MSNNRGSLDEIWNIAMINMKESKEKKERLYFSLFLFPRYCFWTLSWN